MSASVPAVAIMFWVSRRANAQGSVSDVAVAFRMNTQEVRDILTASGISFTGPAGLPAQQIISAR